MPQLNSKINILRVISTPGAFGQTEVSNVLHNNLPCRINWKTGSDRILFDKDTYFRDGVLWCRVVDVTRTDRVQHNDKVYEIVDMENVSEKSQHLKITIKIVE